MKGYTILRLLKSPHFEENSMRLFITPLSDKIVTVGSCRIHDLISSQSLVIKSVGAKLQPGSLLYYAHTINEIIQTIGYVTGEVKIPEDFSPFVFDEKLLPTVSLSLKDFYSESKIIIMEVSESTQIVCEGVYFQINYFFKNFVSKYGSRIRTWYEKISRNEVITEDVIVQTLSNLQDLPSDEFNLAKRVILGTKISQVSKEEIFIQLKNILDQKNVALVSYFTLGRKSDTKIKAREDLITKLGGVCSELAIPIFNPTILIDKYGIENVLDKSGNDIYHYSPEFIPKAGQHLMDYVDYCIKYYKKI